jgi:hypothetical protein
MAGMARHSITPMENASHGIARRKHPQISQIPQISSGFWSEHQQPGPGAGRDAAGRNGASGRGSAAPPVPSAWLNRRHPRNLRTDLVDAIAA